MRAGRLSCPAALLGALALAAAGAPARADEPLWELGLGAAALRLPHYRGADQSRNWLLPMPYVVYRGEFLRAGREGARALLVDGERFEVDLGATASPPTGSRSNEARRGMPDLDPTVEIGPNANLTLARGAGWKLDARVPLRATFTVGGSPQHIGWAAAPNLNLDVRRRGWDFGVQLAALAGDRRLHRHYYEVTPAYATPVRPAYRAAGGRAGWQGTLSATHRRGTLWFGAFVRADSVAGAAFEASPLVRRTGDVSLGVAVAWVFAASTQRVSDWP